MVKRDTPGTNQSPSILRRQRANKHILRAAARDGSTMLTRFDNTLAGYNEDDVEEMRDKYGSNKITKRNEDNLAKRLFRAFVNPFTVILLVLGAVSLFTDFVIAEPGEEDITAVVIISVMVTLSGLLRFVQETRSNNAAKRLTEMVKTTTCVARRFTDDKGEMCSEKKEIPMDQVVVGDVVHLAAGDMIPADVRILEAKDLFISQSALTGESEPVEKFSQVLPESASNEHLFELNNMAFMGSTVISGAATAIVINTGDETALGAIAEQLQGKTPPTSFEKGINSVSWVLIRFMLCMVPAVMLINGFAKGDWLEAFLFGLAIAVGLTPEMLPMIVTANLAKGAVSMSRKKVIVKNLSSIQNFGAIDVLCTDKTGTITQDKVILELHLDIDGNDCPEVLRRGFLNSHYQTGLKNLMDVSIIEHARGDDMKNLWEDYKKFDEIPFDFNRRRMSVAVEDKTGGIELITKGAIEEMLAVSTKMEYKGNIETLNTELQKKIFNSARELNRKGMRVLGVARKQISSSNAGLTVADENDMIFVGYLAFLDPPKESAGPAIKSLNEAGVRVKVLTGDNDAVTATVCKTVGMDTKHIILGAQVEKMSDEDLAKAVEETDIFAKLSPRQKARIVTTLRNNGHTVGFMGDGINDANAMKAADVGISVDNAVDIAKESANIILLEKDLMILERGVIEGRKTYANTIKYIKMTASSNFGNMFSVLAASFCIPFLPMLPLQILCLNLIYDISCTAIPWDNVDRDFLKKPRKWDSKSVGNFMLWIGPTSSVFDITTYLLMYFMICPAFISDGLLFNQIAEGTKITSGLLAGWDMRAAYIAMFQAGWFVESLWSQTLVIHMIRTPLVPFIQSRASLALLTFTTIGIAVGTIIPYTALGAKIGMLALPNIYYPWLALTIFLYMGLATALKKVFVWKYGELL